jgi:hypothetical protein
MDKLTLATNTNMEKYFFLGKIKRIWKSSNKILQILAFLEHSAISGSLMLKLVLSGLPRPNTTTHKGAFLVSSNLLIKRRNLASTPKASITNS